MKSPNFPLKSVDIREVVNASRLKSRWREKVRDALRKQPIPDPLEHLDFHVSLDARCAVIAAEVCSGTYIPQPAMRILLEKSKGLCRQLVVPSARDALILQTLSDALWVELKEKAPSHNAYYAPNDNRFSRVIRGLGDDGYGSVNAWLEFQSAILGFTKTRRYIIVTDIAKFYDCISYDHLRNILAGLSIAKEHSLDLLIYSLSHMLWQPDYMPRVQVGLPQIPFLDAPRLLAHCFLFEMDRMMVDRYSTADYARYMDDIDVGVDTISKAKQILRDLDLSLQTRQVRLNSGKTIILTAKGAHDYFRISDNEYLTELEDTIIKKRIDGDDISTECSLISDMLHDGLSDRRFEGGTGEKILKRCINYARQYKIQISDTAFTQLLKRWPAVRSNVLTWWQHSPDATAKLHLLSDFVCSNEIVDDETLLDVVAAVVNTRLPQNGGVSQQVETMCASLDVGEQWQFYAKAWLLSKYGTAQDLAALVEATMTLWVTEEHLSRLIGGMFPRMIGTSEFGKFSAIIQRRGSRWSQEVFEFHQRISDTTQGFLAVQKFIRAKNSSLPNKISHPKFLMLSSVLRNIRISTAVINDLREIHSYPLSDDFYSKISPQPTPI